MTNLDWAKLGFKLIGFWFMVTAVSMAANVATLIGQPAVTGIALSMLYPATRALIGILIWMYSDRLALSIFPMTAAGQNVVGQSQQEQLFALAISIIGIGLLVDSIPTFLYDLTLFIASRSGEYRSAFGFVPEPSGPRIWNATAEASLVSALVRTLIGFGLLLSPSRIVELIASLRGNATKRS
jgi:hypothetical protein